MVFKPFTHLPRQILTKTFAHGYAQSVVAASQSSYASSTTSFGQFTNYPVSKFTRTSQLQNAFQSTSSSPGAGAKVGHAGSGSTTGNDGGLAAYYAAWQHAQQNEDDNDWKQFQFKKRIGWKSSSNSRESRESRKEDGRLRSESLPPPRTPVDRSYSASALDDIKQAEDSIAEAQAIAKIDAAIAEEIQSVSETHSTVDKDAPKNSLLSEGEQTSSTLSTGDSQLAARTPESSVDSSLQSASQDVRQQQLLELVDRISLLNEAEKFADIPAAFESMLRAGFTPPVEAYNALLNAAIRLPTETHLAIPKALDVYSDMLRRKVVPDKVTYATLIRLLAMRAVDVTNARHDMNQQLLRYGTSEEARQFMLPSHAAEFEILTEDNSLVMGVKLFKVAVSADISFPTSVYQTLLTACAEEGRIDDMLEIFAQMESKQVVPHAAMFPPMIKAYAAAGDLKSAVECYNGYRALAIADNEGTFGIIDRSDNEVYATLIKAYMSCAKEEGGQRFFERIMSSYDNVEDRAARVEPMESTIVLDAFVRHSLDTKNYAAAMEHVEARTLSQGTRLQILSRVATHAADNNDVAAAQKAFQSLPSDSEYATTPAMALLAANLRAGDIVAACPYWNVLSSVSNVTPEFIEPTVFYALELLRKGRVEEGLGQARTMFSRIRTLSIGNVVDQIDEAIEVIGQALFHNAVVLSAEGNMNLIWTMVENGGLVSPVAEHAIANLGPDGIARLSFKDLSLALRVQAVMLINGSTIFDAAHPARFAHILDLVISSNMPLDPSIVRLVGQALDKLGGSHVELARQWNAYLHSMSRQMLPPQPFTPAQTALPSPSVHEDTFDPYAHNTDFKGSAVIADELESMAGSSDTHLNNALIRFKNMRRMGRHPRYVIYAKLIGAASKAGRMSLVHDILGMARSDVPLLRQFRVVKYGWIAILDAMVAASLNLGDRNLAGRYHQELLDMGAAPSANTFGLYITTLKEGTKTFDEATEAVNIFHQALTEQVIPTSFLYNALIGKLGKARRIDDCLRYFADMRNRGIRPTSVTYGTIVNALCRVSDEKLAEETFDEMESMPNYKARPAPYNSLIQYFLNTKRDRSKVLAYYERMKAKGIQPTMHTYKLIMDAYASLEPIDMKTAEEVLNTIHSNGQQPEAVHFASLIHAKGCVMHDMEGARAIFDSVLQTPKVRIQACLYQALFESMVANHQVAATADILKDMARRNVEMTPYIANTLIHGWASEGNIANAKSVYDGIGIQKREPSTYEAMTRAYLASDDREGAARVVQEMLSRGYPSAVAGKIVELVDGRAA
jgi:pentatricopeptide repeat protein